MEQYLLNQIAQITLTLQTNYKRLIFLEINKDINPNYEQIKNYIITQIKQLKLQEDELYKPLEEDYPTAQNFLDYFYDNENYNVKEEYYLCQKRIKKKKKKIVFDSGISEENEEFIELFIEEELITYLSFDHEFTPDEMLIFIKIFPTINEALSYNFYNNISTDINNPNNSNIRKLLIDIKFNWIFETGNTIENEAIEKGFNNLDLNNEIKLPNISEQLKTAFFNFEIKNKLYDIITIMGSSTDKDLILSEIEWFKTYLFYLDPKSIEEINNRIKTYNFQNKDIQSILLQYIETIQLQIIYNSKQKTL